MGANRDSDARRNKVPLASQIKARNVLADSVGLNDAGWSQRYSLESTLTSINKAEELYLQQHRHITWILKGDSLLEYFFTIANGRRRCCSIVRLVIGGVVVSNATLIMSHIFSVYSSLMAAQPPSSLSISSNFWPSSSLIYLEENVNLLIPLFDSKIDEVVDSSNSSSALGLDGFSIPFFNFLACS